MKEARKILDENIDLLFKALETVKNEIENKYFDHCRFENCNFTDTKFLNCKFYDCEFVNCNLNNIDVRNCLFTEVVFDKSKMLGVNWTKAKWPLIKLTSPIKIYHCNISYSSFFELGLTEITIESCRVHEVDFRGCDLTHAILVDSDFTGSQFQHTKLNHADLTDAANYSIDIRTNDIKNAKFSFPDVMALLDYLEIDIEGI